MHHLVVAVLEDFVAMDVFNVKMCIKTEPLFILALVGDLHGEIGTCPLAMFSSRGSNSSWIFYSSSLMASFHKLL
jgi:hypothetical protein